MFRSAAIALHAQASGDAPEWIHFTPAGHRVSEDGPLMVQGRDGRRFGVEDPAAVIEATELPISLDVDHVSLMAGWMPGASSEAFGWLEEIRYVGDDETGEQFSQPGFWGRVEWTDLGLDRVKRKHFRMLSPVIEMRQGEGIDLAHKFVNVALTNLPNLRMVSLNRRGAPKESAHMDANEILDALRAQLDLPEDATEADAVQALADALGVTITIGEAEEPEGGEEAPPADDAAMVEANARIAELEAQLQAHRELDEEQARAAADLAISEGRADEERRGTLERLYREDRASFDAFTARKAPPVAPIMGNVTSPDSTASTPSKMSRKEIGALVEAMTEAEQHRFTSLPRGAGFSKQAAAQKILDARG